LIRIVISLNFKAIINVLEIYNGVLNEFLFFIASASTIHNAKLQARTRVGTSPINSKFNRRNKIRSQARSTTWKHCYFH